MSYSLNSAKGVISGIIWGSIFGLAKGYIRSLDYSSYGINRALLGGELTQSMVGSFLRAPCIWKLALQRCFTAFCAPEQSFAILGGSVGGEGRV